MGIMHFAGLGKSAGAVTAGLGCIVAKHGLHSVQHGHFVENLVVFTSPEIADGSEPAFAADHNEFQSTTVRMTWARGKTNALEVVLGFVEQEFPDTAVYLVVVDVNDFSACFDAVGQATLKFHEPGRVGKHIWANITGGSNLLNAAIVQTAYLSGLIARLYYTFVADLRRNGKYLQAFSTNEHEFRYREIYALKTHFGERHRCVLETLERVERETPGRYATSSELLSRLKGCAPAEFEPLDLPAFKRDFLNVMQGIERHCRVDGPGATGQVLVWPVDKQGRMSYTRWREKRRSQTKCRPGIPSKRTAAMAASKAPSGPSSRQSGN